MPQTSGKSKVVSIRLPNEVVAILSRRITGRRSRWESMGEYIKERLIYDIMRPHKKKEGKETDVLSIG